MVLHLLKTLGTTYLCELLSNYNIIQATKGIKVFEEILNILTGDKHTVFAVKVEMRPLSVANVAQKYKISSLIT